MYIGHYKAVNSPEEFFSSQREGLDFPTQVTVKSKRYLLYSTYHASTPSAVKNIISMAEKNNIKYDVKID